MKKVWVIQTDWSIDSGEHESDCSLYSTYELAKKEFDRAVKEDKECNYEDYDCEDTCYSWEDEDDYWCIWEEGYYAQNHSEIKLNEMIINEECE